MVSLQPVLTAVLAARVLGEHPTRRQWLGLVLGVVGVALVVGPGIAAAGGSATAYSTAGLVACLVALASGTAGTVYQKRHGDGIPLVWGTAVQYAAAAAVLFAVAAATEDMTIRWTGEFVAAFVWLVLGLSLGAVLLLLLLLRRGNRVQRLEPLLPRAAGDGRRGVPALRRAGLRPRRSPASPSPRSGSRSSSSRRGSVLLDRMRPSWATVATCVPSADQIWPKHSARPAEAAGLSVS